MRMNNKTELQNLIMNLREIFENKLDSDINAVVNYTPVYNLPIINCCLITFLASGL